MLETAWESRWLPDFIKNKITGDEISGAYFTRRGIARARKIAVLRPKGEEHLKTFRGEVFHEPTKLSFFERSEKNFLNIK